MREGIVNFLTYRLVFLQYLEDLKRGCEFTIVAAYFPACQYLLRLMIVSRDLHTVVSQYQVLKTILNVRFSHEHTYMAYRMYVTLYFFLKVTVSHVNTT